MARHGAEQAVARRLHSRVRAGRRAERRQRHDDYDGQSAKDHRDRARRHRGCRTMWNRAAQRSGRRDRAGAPNGA